MSRVLIVEDQPAVAKALRMLFDLNDIDTEATSDPDAAMRMIERGGVDVVLQDMNFSPGATSGEEGIALFRRVRAAAPEVPILLLTAWTSLETAVQLVKEGASDYMPKPWDDAKLLATVRNLLHLRALQAENEKLRADRTRTRAVLAREYDLRGIVYESDAMHRVVSLAVQIARSEVPVLITGPNGAGKEKIAEIVHANSRRRQKPLVKVNAGALPDTLIESELFGAEPGAYTGATRLRIGRFESANGGTLFLDEIGNLSAPGQMKLLRVLQSGEFERLGSSDTRRVDVRLLCATNADLLQGIARGAFRQDLYFRLNVVELAVPPLRERREDVLPLAESFLSSGKRLGEAARSALLAHDWPGNVRELQNRLARAAAIGGDAVITPEDLGFSGAARESAEVPVERAQIELAILNANGSVSRAAEALGLSRQALYRRMEKLGIVLERRPR
ncbi:MAG: sigma-54-dependent Fis family transcriptional regulator [Acidobacteria bacterium]|nr:sigma-54-dependent Fis family transcriptional regulator [Acidobacteriota bacterium]MBV9478848.1 sigma-54-dependent Fis family transcriptional regulator [Acidobacteriota bacterium]